MITALLFVIALPVIIAALQLVPFLLVATYYLLFESPVGVVLAIAALLLLQAK